MDGFDTKELLALEQEFLEMTSKYPNKAKTFLRKQGSQLRKKVVANARQKTRKKTGRYIRGFKRGKPYKLDDVDTIRVYNNSPHAHLIEKGHIIKGRDGSEHGFKKGTHVLEETAKDFTDDFVDAAGDFLDEILKGGGLY